MNKRSPEWTLVGEKTFSPDDLVEVIGSFSLPEGHDTIWVRITQLNEGPNSPWSYGILGWRSSEGYELGTIKAYGEEESEVFRLGIGRPPFQRGGSITFKPRSFNLGWIRAGWPWTLRFEAASGSSAISAPSGEPQATLMVPGVPGGNALPDFTIEDGLAWLLFNIFLR